MVALETLRRLIIDAADPNDSEDLAIRGFLAAGLETAIAMYPDADVPSCARMQQKKAVRSPRNRRRTRETLRRTRVLSANASSLTGWAACRRGNRSSASSRHSPDRCVIPAALRQGR